MSGYKPGEQPQGHKIIKLNTNENPYPASEAVTRAVTARLQQGLQRYPDPTAEAFRQRAADILGVQPEWILAGNGSDDLLTICTRAFVPAGARLRLPYPSYILYKTLAQIQGADSQEIFFEPDWRLPAAFGEGTEDVKLVFLPNPNSPSGTMIPPEEILDLAERLPCPLLVDEAYAEFAQSNCLHLVHKSEKILISRSLSKGYALAGLRFGYLVAQPHIIEQLQKVKDSYNCDALSIAGATAAIDDQQWLLQTRAQIVSTRQRLHQELARLGFAPVDSQANFVWAPHPEIPVKRLFEQLREQGVLVRYMDYPGWGDGLRFSVGTDDQIDVCLHLLGQII